MRLILQENHLILKVAIYVVFILETSILIVLIQLLYQHGIEKSTSTL